MINVRTMAHNKTYGLTLSPPRLAHFFKKLVAMSVTLVSSDGFSVELESEKARISGVVNACLEDGDSGRGDDIALPSVSRPDLERIVQFMRLYADAKMPTIPRPLPTNDLTRILPLPYTDFILALSQEDVISLINAANYMDIEPLLQLCAARIATFFHGKTREEIQAMLHVLTGDAGDDGDRSV